MNKRKWLITLAVTTVLAVPFTVFAATSDTKAAKNIRGFFGLDTSKMTDQQKTDVKDYKQKLADLQKDFINKMVANGSITKEQGDAQIKRIDDALKNGTDISRMPGFGMGGSKRGMMDKSFMPGVDLSKLTDAQKADLTASIQKMADLVKEYAAKEVTNGLITKDQGDSITKKVDDTVATIEKNGFSNAFGASNGLGMMKFFGGKGIDTSKLTDQQKADMQDFSTKMTDLEKELINKMVANGAITKDQGDSAIKRMDSMKGMLPQNGFHKGFGMRKEHDSKAPGSSTPSATTTPGSQS